MDGLINHGYLFWMFFNSMGAEMHFMVNLGKAMDSGCHAKGTGNRTAMPCREIGYNFQRMCSIRSMGSIRSDGLDWQGTG